MTVLGYILIAIGSFWCFGSLQNQGERYRKFINKLAEQSAFSGIIKYLEIEIFLGFGLGVAFISGGYYLLHNELPVKLIFLLFALLFYVLACFVSYINITEGVTPKTQLSMFQHQSPLLSSILPIGQPLKILAIYVVLLFLAFYL